MDRENYYYGICSMMKRLNEIDLFLSEHCPIFYFDVFFEDLEI